MIRTAAAVTVIALAVSAIGVHQTRDTGARPPAGAPSQTGTAVLAGAVVSDDGKPVRRAAVRLAGSELPGGRIGVTDDAGRFTFTRLPAGSFVVSASRPGYVTTYYGSKRPGRGPSVPVGLSAGQRLSVSLTMLRGAAIAGTVTDPFGHPAPQVTVRAISPGVVAPPSQGSQVPAGSATTDDRGMFRIYGLPPGDYLVSASPPLTSTGDARLVTDAEVRWALDQLSPGTRTTAGAAGATMPPAERAVTYAPVFFPGTTDAENAARISLGPGQERGGVVLPLQFVPTARIDGIVLGPSGQGASGVSIVLLPKSAGMASLFPATPGSGLPSVARVPVSPDGRFSTAGVTPGQYTLVARTGVDAALLGSGPGAGTVWGETDVVVNGRDISDVVVALQPGAKLSGTIVFEGTSLPVPTNMSVVRVSMSSAKAGAMALGTPVASVTPAGGFVFPSLISGPYTINVTAPPAASGPPRWTVKSVVAGGRDVTDGTLELRTGEGLSGVVITFSDKETELAGALLDAAGRPTSAFSIVVFTTNRAFWTAGSRRVQSVRPATNGTFRMAGLPAGEYSMVAVMDSEASIAAWPRLGDPP